MDYEDYGEAYDQTPEHRCCCHDGDEGGGRCACRGQDSNLGTATSDGQATYLPTCGSTKQIGGYSVTASEMFGGECFYWIKLA